MTQGDIATQLRSLSRAQINLLHAQYERREQDAITAYCNFRTAGDTGAAERAYADFEDAHSQLLTIEAQSRDLNERGLL